MTTDLRKELEAARDYIPSGPELCSETLKEIDDNGVAAMFIGPNLGGDAFDVSVRHTGCGYTGMKAETITIPTFYDKPVRVGYVEVHSNVKGEVQATRNVAADGTKGEWRYFDVSLVADPPDKACLIDRSKLHD